MAYMKVAVCNPKYPGAKVISQACDALDMVYSEKLEDLSDCAVVLGYNNINQFLDEVSDNCIFGKFPRAHRMCRKSIQSRIFEVNRGLNPELFGFWPQTFIDSEMTNFDKLEAYMQEEEGATIICKPSAGSQGTGIKLFDNFDTLKETMSLYPKRNCVYQKYVSNPLLVGGLKFDLRIYVLVQSVDPFVCHICSEGLVRFCTVAYQEPNPENLELDRSHLTNYCLNKESTNYKHPKHSDDTESTKRALTVLWEQIRENYPNADLARLWEQICGLCQTTMKTLSPLMRAVDTSYDTMDLLKGKCWHIFGMDILIDDKFDVFLLEVNAGPSLNISSFEQVDEDFEPTLPDTICNCEDREPHIHKTSIIDQLIKSIVVQGALSITMDIPHASRASWQKLDIPMDYKNFDIVHKFLTHVLDNVMCGYDMRLVLLQRLIACFPQCNSDSVRIVLTHVEETFAKVPRMLLSGDDCTLLYMIICLTFKMLADQVHGKKKKLKRDTLLHHILMART